MSLVNLFFNLIKRQFKPIEIDEIDQHFIKRQYFDITKYCIKKLFHAFPPSFTYWKTCCLNSPVERQDSRNTPSPVVSYHLVPDWLICSVSGFGRPGLQLNECNLWQASLNIGTIIIHMCVWTYISFYLHITLCACLYVCSAMLIWFAECLHNIC